MKKNLIPLIILAIISVANPIYSQGQVVIPVLSVNTQLEMPLNRNASFEYLSAYLETHLEYPEEAKKSSIEGLVTVEAIIGATGEIMSAGLVDGIGFGCDESVLKLVSNMPNWAPAIENGQYMAQKVFIRVRFKLQ